MKKVLLSATVLAFISFPFALMAQEEKKADKETEEVIIRKNGDREMNIKVEINGDKVIVNGKPLAEFKDDQITINKRKMIIRDGDRSMMFDMGPGSKSFSLGDGFMENFGDDDESSSAFLGVTTDKTNEGVKISEVIKGSAAEKAGLKKGDVITKIGNEAIEDASSLSDIISAKKPKDEVKIYYKRSGKENNVNVVLGERKGSKKMVYSFRSPEGMSRSFSMPRVQTVPNIDLYENSIDDMNEELDALVPRHRKLGLKIQDTEEGGNVKVINVEEGSASEKAGIKKDDIITEIDGKKINNTDDARDQLHAAESKSTYKIKATRNGSEQNFEVKIPKKLKTANL